MNDQLSRDQILTQCERYWLETGVSPATVADMKAELRSHLEEAEAAGKPARAVVGSDLKGFAEAWAEAYRGPAPTPKPAVVATASSRNVTTPALLKRLGWWALGLLIVALALVALFGPKEEAMDLEYWSWIWVGATLLFGVGEMLTAGFFLLPFAVGAAAAGLLAFLGVAVPIQLIVFVLVSVVALVFVQRFARRDEIQHPVGANRYIGSRATVLEEVNRHKATGLVRMGTERWRATTDLDIPIPENLEVTVVEVRGTRLVVVPTNGRLLD